MGVSLVVAVTDSDWFETLRFRPDLAEVNFWAPSAASFVALEPGELFLFKLHSPRNFIVGGGIFTYANTLPSSLAWEAFGEANGAASLPEMRARIARYRRGDSRDRADFPVGCRILTQPFFLREDAWIPVPSSWARNIVSFKTYDAEAGDGLMLWKAVSDRVDEVQIYGARETIASIERFGAPHLVRPRLGQGAFRILVTDNYKRRCVITGERTLPALEAAHIQPYGNGGEHDVRNGLLFRRDIHKLFDDGYVTVTPQRRFEVSRRIKEEFENGRHYYALHGREISPPSIAAQGPDPAALDWHNVNRFLG
jgi:putative restriction endonuclease